MAPRPGRTAVLSGVRRGWVAQLRDYSAPRRVFPAATISVARSSPTASIQFVRKAKPVFVGRSKGDLAAGAVVAVNLRAQVAASLRVELEASAPARPRRRCRECRCAFAHRDEAGIQVHAVEQPDPVDLGHRARPERGERVRRGTTGPGYLGCANAWIVEGSPPRSPGRRGMHRRVSWRTQSPGRVPRPAVPRLRSDSARPAGARYLAKQALQAAQPQPWVRELTPFPGLPEEPLPPHDVVAVNMITQELTRGAFNNAKTARR